MLTWLIEQATKVYYWFGEQFWTLVNKVIQLPADLASWVGGLINDAETTISGWINDVYTWAGGAFDGVKTWAQGIVDNAYNSIVTWVNGLLTDINGAIDTAKYWVYDQAVAMVNGVIGFINQTITNFGTAIQGVQGWVIGLLKPYQDIYNGLVALLNFFTPDVLRKIGDLVHTIYTFITDFMSDPMGFILSIVWKRIFDLICYGLGYGLGSVKYTLPPLPDWSGKSNTMTGDNVKSSDITGR
jgi:hypothetical protein